MAVTVGDLAVGLRLDGAAFGQSLAGLRRQLETDLVKAVTTRAAPALQQLRKLLASAVRDAVVTVARALTARLARALGVVQQAVKQVGAPIQFLAKLMRGYLLPALLALAHDGSRSFAQLTNASVAAAGQIQAGITTVVFGLDWLANRALGTANSMIVAWQLAVAPIPLVIAAVQGLVAVVVAAWQAILLATSTDFTAVWTFVTTIWLLIQQAVQLSLDLITQGVLIAWQLIVDTTLVMWTNILLAIQLALTAILLAVTLNWQLILDLTIAQFTALWTFLTVVWATIVLTVQLAALAIYTTLLVTWQLIIDWTLAAFTLLMVVVQTTWALVVLAVQQAVWAIVNIVESGWFAMAQSTVDAFAAVYNVIVTDLQDTLGFTQGWVPQMVNAFAGLQVIPTNVGAIFRALAQIVSDILTSLAALVTDKAGQITDALNGIANAIRAIGDAALSLWKVILGAVFIDIAGFLLFLGSEAILAGAAAVSALGKALQTLAAGIQDLVNAIRSAGNLIGDFIHWIGGLFGANSLALNANGLSSPMPAALGSTPSPFGGLSSATSGGLHIENFYATPNQSPADLAAELDWISRGGG